MPFAPRIIAEHLTNAFNVPWATAPAPVQAAAKAADQSIADHLNAASALEDAEIGIPIAASAWDAAGKAAVRAGEPLPNHDGPDAAKFAHQIAVDDEHLTERKMAGARSTLASLLSDPATRDSWRADLEKQITAGQAKLAKAATDLGVVCAEVAQGIAFSEFLGTWPAMLTPPAVTTPDPAGSLRRLASAKLWTAPVPAGEARIMEPAAPDTRPPVWVVNPGGAIHDVTAKDADALLDVDGYRLATSDEAKQAHARQTGSR